MADGARDDEEIEGFDLSRQVFSGADLTPRERAEIRSLLQAWERSRWLQKRAWIFLTWFVGLPAAIAAAVANGEDILRHLTRLLGK
jgi:hypothetical protein